MKLSQLLFVLASLGVASEASATLGAAPLNTANRLVVSRAAMPPIAQASYHTQEATLASGVVVREYVANATERVFAVVWQGPAQPDFALVLGNSYPGYLTAVKARTVGRRSVASSTPELVVESGGRMRGFFGRAILPGQLPAGVNLADIK